MLNISIEFKKKFWRVKQNNFDFRGQHIKIVQKKVLQLNQQILFWPV